MDHRFLGVLLLGSLTITGCQRLNPSWCDTQGRCAAGMFCNPATNTCEGRDARPDILGRWDLPPEDAAEEQGPADGHAESDLELGLGASSARVKTCCALATRRPLVRAIPLVASAPAGPKDTL